MNLNDTRILVTGGAGYIGSHTILELIGAGYSVVVVDNLENGHREALERVERMTSTTVPLFVGDICDSGFLESVFSQFSIDAVVHFAGLKSVEESFKIPESYYRTNIGGTSVLTGVMRRFGVRRLVFSSSATVYGEPSHGPVNEEAPASPINPYGVTKLACEELLRSLALATDWSITALRYFNPVGAHPSSAIGEDPKAPTNLVPIVVDVAAGTRASLTVFGSDYPTPDGTCIRDYIHVCDLATAHVAALESHRIGGPGFRIYNVGTGRGYSVLDVVSALEEICGHPVPKIMGPRRAGDAPFVVANAAKAALELEWRSKFGLREMVESAWNWKKTNPDGFRTA